MFDRKTCCDIFNKHFSTFFFLFPIYLKPVVFRSTEECIRLVYIYTYMHTSMYMIMHLSQSLLFWLASVFLHNTFTHVQISKSQMLRFASTGIPQSLLFWLISVSIHKIFIQVSLIHLNILVSNVKICKYMISQPSMFWPTSLYISVPPPRTPLYISALDVLTATRYVLSISALDVLTANRYVSQPSMFWPTPFYISAPGDHQPAFHLRHYRGPDDRTAVVHTDSDRRLTQWPGHV